jgi:acetyltransferase-like isoleucine patch superfamily enzyme
MTPASLVNAVLHAIEGPLFGFRAFGTGSVVAPFPRKIVGAHRIAIGAHCFIGANATLWVCEEYLGRRYTPTFEVGDRTMVGRDVVVACIEAVRIGASVTVADRVFIGDCYHGYEDPSVAVLDQPMSGAAAVTIGDGSFIGVGAAILPGVTLGHGCVVAANAVVTRSFEANTVLLGNPARPIRTFDRERGVWVP